MLALLRVGNRVANCGQRAIQVRRYLRCSSTSLSAANPPQHSKLTTYGAAMLKLALYLLASLPSPFPSLTLSNINAYASDTLAKA
jgi:hypothetical protein